MTHLKEMEVWEENGYRAILTNNISNDNWAFWKLKEGRKWGETEEKKNCSGKERKKRN